MLREKESMYPGQTDHEVLVEVANKQTEIQLPPSKRSKVNNLKITGFSETAAIYVK